MTLNPIAIARNSENLSQVTLARKVGVSRNYIIRVEQGCYIEPGTPLTHYASSILRKQPNEIVKDYKEFQEKQRKITLTEKFHNVAKIIAPAAVPLELNDAGKYIVFNHELFRHWREGYWNTVTQFSIDMCVHPYSVSHYEDGDMYGMPKQLVEIMRANNLLGENFDPEKRWYYALGA